MTDYAQTDYAQATELKRAQSPIAERLEQLREEIMALDAAIGALRDRLDPVMGPEMARDGDPTVPTVADVSSDVNARLRSSIVQVRALADVVGIVTVRLEV